MLRKLIIATFVAQAFVGLADAQPFDEQNTSPFDPSIEDLTITDEPPMLGIHWSRGVHGSMQLKRKLNNPNMTYHGGKIMPYSVIKAIFWGTSWSGYTGDKFTGMDSFYTGWKNSNYATTTTEYSGTNGTVTASSTYGGHLVDTSAASGGGSTSAILAEV